MIYAIAIGLTAGLAMPMQTSVNAKLGQGLRSPYLASICSFLGAWVLVAAILLLSGNFTSIPFAVVTKEPLWIWSGGFCGGVLVFICMVCLPKLGSIETMVMLVLGQIGAGMLIDGLGLFGMFRIPITISRVIGGLLVLAGTVAVAIGNEQKTSKKFVGKNDIAKDGELKKLLTRLAVILAGILAGIQIAVNSRLGAVIGDSFKATLVSMSVGVITCVAITLAIFCIKGGKKAIIDYSLEGFKLKWWMFTGGLFAVIIVGSNVIIGQMIGTGFSVILNVVGQTVGGMAIDAFGFLGIEKKPMNAAKFIGSIVMIAGIAIVSLF